MSVRRRSRICCLISLTILQSAWGQPADSAKKAEEPGQSPDYEDRLIDAGNLAPLPVDSDDASYNAEGWPRAWRVEAYTSNFDQGGTITRENGLVLSGRLDTPDFGALTLDATLRSRPNSSIFTLWQRGLPFDGGWRANNGAGMLNTLGIDLSRSQYRFYLPTFPVAGVASEWLHNGNFQFQASVGEPGLYEGLRLSGFSRLGGNLFTTGAQWVITPHWQAGFQMADAQGVKSVLEGSDLDARIAARSWYGGSAWQDGSTRLQANLLDSEANQGRHNLGVWLDGETRDGRYRHNYGLFRLDPDLFWGYVPITRDIQGGYYRINYQSQQWLWDAGLDSVNSLSGRGVDGVYGTGSIRYQVNRALGVGGGATVRQSVNNASAAYAFVDKQSRWGTTRVQFDVASEEATRHGKQLTVDQTWPTQVGLRVSTSLSVGQDIGVGERINRRSFAVFGGTDLSNNLSLDGNVRVTSSSGSENTTGKYANVSLNWRMNSHWSLSATYYDNRSEDQNFLTVASLIQAQAAAPVPRDRAFFLVLRYEDHAGTLFAPLGGSPGSGAGSIIGYLYYDANNDGRRDASETGAVNVTVLLDGKFATRTDAQGKFEFPLVATGTHTITVVPDNLPLPYAVSGDGKREISVRTREISTIDIGANKLK